MPNQKSKTSILSLNMFGRSVIKRLTNSFGSFSVEELKYEGRPARVLFSGPQHAAQSGIPLDDNPRLLFDYNQLLLELALDLNPSKVLVLGGGTLTLPMALINNLQTVQVTVVEQNADLIALAGEYFNYHSDHRLRLEIGDALSIVGRLKDRYDLVITDIFDNFSIPQAFRTISFARSIKELLNVKGLIATNFIAATSGYAAQPLRQIVAAYSKAIGPVKVVKADQDYAYWTPQNMIIMAFNDQTVNQKLLKGIELVDLPDIQTEDYLS